MLPVLNAPFPASSPTESISAASGTSLVVEPVVLSRHMQASAGTDHFADLFTAGEHRGAEDIACAHETHRDTPVDPVGPVETAAPLETVAPVELVVPQTAPELDAEEWLFHALDQQQLSLQVREIHQSPAGQNLLGQAPVAAFSALAARAETLSNTEPRLPAVNASLAGRLAPSTHWAGEVTNPELTPSVDSVAEGEPLLAERSTSLAPPSNHLSATNLAAGDKPLAELAHPGLKPSALDQAAPVKTPALEAKWGEQLLYSLRDQVQVQIQQRIQQATIRLDPPELGSLEIFLSHEAGRIHVQINASQADVARLLQQTSDRLRQELAGGQFTQVDVSTSSEGHTGQHRFHQRQQPWEQPDAIAINGQIPQSTAGGGQTKTRRPGAVNQSAGVSDLLIKV